MPKLKQLVESPNIVKLLDEEQVTTIGQNVLQGYYADRMSRQPWEQRNKDAMELALQVVTEKTFPWTNASNVKFPLVTIAALQFLARVSILTKGRQLVKCDVVGRDPSGMGAIRARRISTHMSYQLVEEDTEWISEDEKAKFSASIIGCSFKQSYFDPVEGKNISEHVAAGNLVVDYFTKSFKKAHRVTQLLMMSANDVQERVRREIFCSLEGGASDGTQTVNLLQTVSDEVQGIVRPRNSGLDFYNILAQHCWLDLDDDGYQEPYIVYVDENSGQVLRIVARFFDAGDVFRVNDADVRRLRDLAAHTDDGKAQASYKQQADILHDAANNHIIRIEAQQYFTKYTFIPSPDGGFYDLGFGSFLGPLNESVNTLINQLTDAGTMANTAGGFLGRGVKLKGGKTSFEPFEWRPVDSTGDDLRKNIFPLPVRDPSMVLFQMLNLLISYSEKISGSTDIMSGVSPGQNTPAETSRNSIEQGMKIFSGIYARMHRAFKDELQKLFNLNKLYLETTPQWIALTSGDTALISPDDYSTTLTRVYPAADVAIVSEEQRKQKAMMVKQAAGSTPGYNRYLVEKEFLEAYDVQGIEQLLPDPSGPNAIPPPKNQKLEIEQGYLELEKQKLQMDVQSVMIELQQTQDLNAAKISELHAKAEKLLAEAESAERNTMIAAINAQIGAAREHQRGMAEALKIMQGTIGLEHQRHTLEQQLKGNSHDSNRKTGMGAASGDSGVSEASSASS